MSALSRSCAGAALGGALLLLLGGGCAGYKLGPTGELRPGEHTLQINPVINTTAEPRLGPALSHALRKQVQRDGTFLLRTRGEGDIVLNTTLHRYHRRGIAYQAQDAITPEDYEITLEATVVAMDRRSGRELLNREVKSRTTVRIGSDLVSAERQALPLLADELARAAISLLADGAW